MILTVVPADPAGNRTLLVLDWVEPALRPSLAAWMLERGIGRGEQVGFVAPPQRGGWGRLQRSSSMGSGYPCLLQEWTAIIRVILPILCSMVCEPKRESGPDFRHRNMEALYMMC